MCCRCGVAAGLVLNANDVSVIVVVHLVGVVVVYYATSAGRINFSNFLFLVLFFRTRVFFFVLFLDRVRGSGVTHRYLIINVEHTGRTVQR